MGFGRRTGYGKIKASWSVNEAIAKSTQYTNYLGSCRADVYHKLGPVTVGVVECCFRDAREDERSAAKEQDKSRLRQYSECYWIFATYVLK